MHRYLILLLLCTCGPAMAHEFTPTYPKMRPSYVSGLVSTEMSLFNARQDVEWYTVGVYDKQWGLVPYATNANDNLFRVKHLERKKIKVYLREQDLERAVYICTKSKLIVTGSSKTAVASRICSKIK